MRELAQAEPLPDGTRLLHIGLPKAGSTALQGALHAARPQLAEHDVLLAGPTQHPYAAAAIATGHSQPWYTDRQARSWQRLSTQLRTSTHRVSVLSSETFSRADRQHAQQICTAISDSADHVHIAIVARPLALVLPSTWQQALRNIGVPPFEEWLKQVVADPTANDTAGRFIRRFDIPRKIRTWSRAVEPDHITLVVLDPADRGHLLDSFDRLLDLPRGTLQPQPKLANESLPYPEAEMLRMVQQRFFEEGHTYVEWMTQVTRWIRNDIRDLRSPQPHEKIRPPRWAVEALNDLTAPWLETIRSSGVTVVGDLDKLLADPDQYGELADPPAVVPVSSAAELAHFLYRAGRAYREGGAEPRAVVTEPAAEPAIVEPTVAETPARELAREVGRRAVRRLLRR